MDVGAFVLLGFFVWLGWWMLSRFGKGRGKVMFCTTCGHEGKTTTHTRGSMTIEIVAWLLFIVPGLIYSIWRHASRGQVCEKCGGAQLVPPDSPIAIATKRSFRQP